MCSSQNIVAVSKGFIREFSLTCDKDLIGRRYADFTFPSLSFYEENHEELSRQNELVITNKRRHIFFEVFDERKFSRLYIVHRYPIITDGLVCGIYVYMRPFALQRYSDIVFCIFGKTDYCIKPLRSDFNLTSKQLLVLFLYLRNYSYTEISSWLNAFGIQMSAGRVNEHLDNLKIAFDVKDRKALRQKTIDVGFPSVMPAGFLKQGSFLIDDYLIHLKGFTNYPLQSHVVAEAYLSGRYNRLTTCKLMFSDELGLYIKLFQNYYEHTDEAAYLAFDDGSVLVKTEAYIDIEPYYKQVGMGEPFRKKLDYSFIDVLDVDGEHRIYLRNMRQIGAVSGQNIILVNCRLFYTPNLPQMMTDIFKIFSFPSIKLKSDYRITERQHMVLFFYARNYSAAEVALIMTDLGYKMSVATVNEHLVKIKLQLGVSTREQLLDAALVIAYDLIPGSLLRTGTYSTANTILESWVV